MRNFSIKTDHVIEARRPDLVLVDKKRRTCKIIHFAVPGVGEGEGEREDRKVSRSKKGVTEDLECEDYTLVVGFLGAIA